MAWNKKKKKPTQPQKWDYLWLQLKPDGQMHARIHLALLGPLTMILYGPVCVSCCDLWVLHFRSEPPVLNSKPKKNRSAPLLGDFQHRSLPQRRYGYSQGDCGGTLWKIVHKPNVFYMYFNIFKQKQAAFYASKCANICKNWNRFLYFHQALETTTLALHRLSF